MNRFDVGGRVVLITGGSRGLGRAMALAFAEAGARVAVASRKLHVCEDTVREIEARGSEGFAHACHVGHWDELAGLVDAVTARFGRIDVLVNNAGMSLLYDGLENVSEAQFDKVVGVNFKGPFRLCALVGGPMKARGWGRIINVSSTASLHAVPHALPYAAAKAALNNITAGFAEALAPEVCVNGIVVGPFATDVAAHWPDPPDPDNPGWTRDGFRVGLPDEVVGAALYLASDAASYTSGALIRVDGGPVRVHRTAGTATQVG
jgi:NAD(P)-dependent dehydrogenase (short-subunit alcohol dehydrogenase family)